MTVEFLLISETNRHFVLFFQQERGPEKSWGLGKLPQLPPFRRVWRCLEKWSEVPQWGPGHPRDGGTTAYKGASSSWPMEEAFYEVTVKGCAE